MARTFRRRQERHEYRWVLSDWNGHVDPKSKASRKALARFHSDKSVTMGPAPRWYRKVFDHKLRTHNNRMLRRWLKNPHFDPVFQPTHLHMANWSWW